MATMTSPKNRARSALQERGAEIGEQNQQINPERWTSLIGGGVLALWGLRRAGLSGLGLALLGGGLAYRGATGRTGARTSQARGAHEQGIEIKETLVVSSAPEEVYRYWRNFENLPRFLRYVESVRSTEGNRTHWVARGPLNVPVEWDAEITRDEPNQSIAWRSLPGSEVDTEGSVRFGRAPGKRGTFVQVEMRYDPPAGRVGATVAWFFGRSAEQEIREDLRHFKQIIETGEIPTTRGQPTGRGRETWSATGMRVVQDRFAKSLGMFGIGLGLAEFLIPGMLGELIGVRNHHGLMRLMGAREIATGLGILKQPRPTGWLWGRVAGDLLDLRLLQGALASPQTGKIRAALATGAVLGVTALDLVSSLQLSSGPIMDK
jgi:uncharacterized membrane protein